MSPVFLQLVIVENISISLLDDSGNDSLDNSVDAKKISSSKCSKNLRLF